MTDCTEVFEILKTIFLDLYLDTNLPLLVFTDKFASFENAIDEV